MWAGLGGRELGRGESGFCYLCHGGYVFICVCLFICLSVNVLFMFRVLCSAQSHVEEAFAHA